MFFKSKKINSIIGISAAAVCMVSSLRIAPISQNDVAAAGSMTAFEITENMEIGWNLGNSLDATSNKNNPGLSTETSWGNPMTTQELISAIKAKGFNTIRIPTTWYQHLDEDNNIDEAWIARVKEIIDYCYNEDMYVILNIHHEEWINRSDFADAYDEMSPKLIKIWTQIAEYFSDYDQHLIFEGMNEPRATGVSYEWTGTQAEYAVVNKLNADFVNTVRSIDSPYKDTRLLMIPSYAASAYDYVYSYLEVPSDDYIAVSLHAYAPYDFAMNPDVDQSKHETFTPAYASQLDNLFGNMRSYFTDKDIPVVIGEFSASNYNNTEARCNWAEYYIGSTKKYGIPCVLWDNNAVTNSDAGEAHGYINRRTLEWYEASEPVIDTMMSVINDDSIVWGSERKCPIYTHPDIDSGSTLYKDDTGTTIDASVTGGNCTANYDVSWSSLENKDVAIKFTGDTPILAFMDSSWGNWTEINAYHVDTEAGIAYYSYDSIKAAWTADTEPIHLCARTGGVTTITQIALIDLPEITQPQPVPTPSVQKVKGTVESLDLPVSITIDGTQYILMDNASAAISESGVKVGDTISFTGTFAADSGTYTIEDISDLVVSEVKMCTVNVSVIDMNGNPVPGAEVMVSGQPASTTHATPDVIWDVESWNTSDENPKTFTIPSKNETDEYYTAYYAAITNIPDGYYNPMNKPLAELFDFRNTDSADIVFVLAKEESYPTLYGDANDDGQLGIADVVKVMMYASDKEANPMTDAELNNADVYNRGDGVFTSDALSIQKKLAQVIDELPESWIAPAVNS